MSEDESLPDIEVLRCRYQELRDQTQSQKSSWEREGEHNRRMLRLLFLFTGVLITGISTIGSSSAQPALFDDTHCAVFSGTGCLYTDQLLFIGMVSLLASTLFYLKGSFGGLVVGFTEPEEEHTSRGEWTSLEDLKSEKEYLAQRIDDLDKDIEDNSELHFSKKRSSRIGAACLLVSIISFLVLALALGAGRGIGMIPLYLGGGIITILLLIIEWEVMKDFPPIRWARSWYGRVA